LIPGGLEQVPGLVQRLHAGCRIVDTACGTGAGLVRLARTYQNCEIVGVDERVIYAPHTPRYNVQVLRQDGTVLKTMGSGQLDWSGREGIEYERTVYWNGLDASGRRVPAGTYKIKATVTDRVGISTTKTTTVAVSWNQLVWKTISRTISAGDEIEILVWEEPSFNTQAVVSAQGVIAVPLIGARTISPFNGSDDWIVTKADHWLFEGTGMKNGDRIPGLVGWEFHGSPADIPGLEVVAAGPTFTGGDTNGNGRLDLGETWTYTASRIVTVGQYTNIGKVRGDIAGVAHSV
jgi:hypothetical protein